MVHSPGFAQRIKGSGGFVADRHSLLSGLVADYPNAQEFEGYIVDVGYKSLSRLSLFSMS